MTMFFVDLHLDVGEQLEIIKRSFQNYILKKIYVKVDNKDENLFGLLTFILYIVIDV